MVFAVRKEHQGCGFAYPQLRIWGILSRTDNTVKNILQYNILTKSLDFTKLFHNKWRPDGLIWNLFTFSLNKTYSHDQNSTYRY